MFTPVCWVITEMVVYRLPTCPESNKRQTIARHEKRKRNCKTSAIPADLSCDKSFKRVQRGEGEFKQARVRIFDHREAIYSSLFFSATRRRITNADDKYLTFSYIDRHYIPFNESPILPVRVHAFRIFKIDFLPKLRYE